LLSQKEHEESVKALKLQLETSSKPQDASSSAQNAQSEALQAQLAQALAEVGSLKEQLQASQTASNAMKAQQATAAAPPVASNAAAPGGDVAQITVERDRAIANLASQSQAWNVEKEDLKKQLEKMKSDFSAKLAAADKPSGTPGGPADAESASRLQKLDAILKESIKNGDLRGAAVDQVGKVKLSPRAISPAVVFSCSAPHFFERF
jgi:DNA repair exonuclease SbcCD ATPase subunit